MPALTLTEKVCGRICVLTHFSSPNWSSGRICLWPNRYVDELAREGGELIRFLIYVCGWIVLRSNRPASTDANSHHGHAYIRVAELLSGSNSLAGKVLLKQTLVYSPNFQSMKHYIQWGKNHKKEGSSGDKWDFITQKGGLSVTKFQTKCVCHK